MSQQFLLFKKRFLENELVRKAVVRKFRTTAVDGKTYQTNYYNLDVIIACGIQNERQAQRPVQHLGQRGVEGSPGAGLPPYQRDRLKMALPG